MQQQLQHQYIPTLVAILVLSVATAILSVGPAVGQSLDDIRITEIQDEGEQWLELVNTGDGPVDVSDAQLCAAVGTYEDVGSLDVKESDGNLTLDAGEYIALNWGEIKSDNGDLGLYQSGTSGSGFGDSDNIIDYVRWGSDGSEAEREDVAVGAGIWTEGDFVESAQSGATIAFLNGDPAMNDDPDDWGEGNPTPGSGNVVLPVELTSFDAVVNGTDVVLTWTTASETNNAGFEVQHRTDTGFEKVSFVEGVGTTTEAQNYRFRVTELSPGQHTFRLKQVDLDGSVEFGPTVDATVRARVVSNLRPNPTSGPARLDLSVQTPQTVTVEVYNLLGERVRTVFEGTVTPGQVREFTVDGSRLSSGAYFIQVVGEQFENTRKLVVAN